MLLGWLGHVAFLEPITVGGGAWLVGFSDWSGLGHVLDPGSGVSPPGVRRVNGGEASRGGPRTWMNGWATETLRRYHLPGCPALFQTPHPPELERSASVSSHAWLLPARGSRQECWCQTRAGSRLSPAPSYPPDPGPFTEVLSESVFFPPK